MSARLAALKERADAETKKARDVAEAATAEGREMNDDEKGIYDTSMGVLKEILETVKTVKADESLLDAAKQFASEMGVPQQPELQERVKNLGLTVVESPAFKAMLKPFTTPAGGIHVTPKTRIQSDPIPVKSMYQKALFTGASSTSGGAFVVNDRTDIVEMLGRKRLTVRDLVSNRRTTSDAVEFVRQTSHTNAAAVVAEATSSARPTAPGTAGALVNVAGGGYKPEGSWAFEIVTTNVKTIAEWVPATKRSLADVAQLEGLINDELRLDVLEAEENQIMNGDGTGENFTGISATSGIQTQAFATDMFTSVRKGITKVKTVGRSVPTAILMNPADAESVDLAQDANDRYYYGGPFAITPRTMWGLPIIESESQTSGFATVADWSKVVIWDREQTTVTATDSHEDFFVRNLVAILAEERLAMGVVRPTAICTVDLVA